MASINVFCPLITTGAGETALQTAGETRFVVDCKVNPAATPALEKSGQRPPITLGTHPNTGLLYPLRSTAQLRNYKTATRPTFHLPAGREFLHGLATC